MANRVGRATDKRAELHCCDVSKIDFCVLDIGGRKDDFDGYCGGNKCCFACRRSACCLRFNKRLVAVAWSVLENAMFGLQTTAQNGNDTMILRVANCHDGGTYEQVG